MQKRRSPTSPARRQYRQPPRDATSAPPATESRIRAFSHLRALPPAQSECLPRLAAEAPVRGLPWFVDGPPPVPPVHRAVWERDCSWQIQSLCLWLHCSRKQRSRQRRPEDNPPPRQVLCGEQKRMACSPSLRVRRAPRQTRHSRRWRSKPAHLRTSVAMTDSEVLADAGALDSGLTALPLHVARNQDPAAPTNRPARTPSMPPLGPPLRAFLRMRFESLPPRPAPLLQPLLQPQISSAASKLLVPGWQQMSGRWYRTLQDGLGL